MNDSNATAEETSISSPSEAERMFKVSFYVFLFITGTIGNLLVVAIVKAKNKHRTVNDYFILNLAISDLTFLWFALPFYYYELFEKFAKFEFYCKFLWPVMSSTLIVSIFTLTLMAVERCRAILFPFKPRIKKHTLFMSIMSVWVLSVLCMVPLMVVTKPIKVHCQEQWPRTEHRMAYTAILFVLQFAMPITVIAVAYITIAVTLVKTKVPNRTAVNQRGQLIKQKTRADNIHIIRTVAIIIVLFIICMLPNQIAWILIDFGGKDYQSLSEKFWLLAEALMFLHSCVNPIIYGSLTRQFRDGYIQYLRYFCCCGRRYALNTISLSEHNKSRVTGRYGYQGSPKTLSIVNGVKASCHGQTVNSSSRFGTYRSPPSTARSAASSLKSQKSQVRSHPSLGRLHTSSVRSYASPKRSPSSSLRSHPNSKEWIVIDPSLLRTKSSGGRPSSPLVIDNKEAVDAKPGSAVCKSGSFIVRNESEFNHGNGQSIHKILNLDTGIFLPSINGAEEFHESAVLENPSVHNHHTTEPLIGASHDRINQSEEDIKRNTPASKVAGVSQSGRKNIIQSKESKATSESVKTAADQSEGASIINNSFKSRHVLKNSGSSDNQGIDSDDERLEYQDTHL